MKRRSFLGALALPLGLVRGSARALGETSRVEFVGLVLPGLEEARPLARARLAWAMRMRTSVETVLEPRALEATDPRLFDAPLLVLSGAAAFPLPPPPAIAALRRHLEAGGMLWVDDAATGDAGFDTSVRALLARVLPGRPLASVPTTHVLHHAFYLVPRATGRVAGPDSALGVTLDERLAVLYTQCDVTGALSRDAFGEYPFACVPGGESQREMAHRFAVNLAMYALCLDYKDDQVHVPFIMRRRPGR